MLKDKIKLVVILSLIAIITSTIVVYATYIPNNRDTLTDPEPFVFEEFDFTSDYTQLYKKGNFKYYYRKSTDCFFIEDTRNGYVWSTGINQLTAKQLVRNYEDALMEELLMHDNLTPEEEAAITDEIARKYLTPVSTMTDTYVYRANSAITVEYFDEVNATKRVSTNNPKVSVKYSKDKENKNVFMFSYDFTKVIDLQIDAIFTFDERGINIQIPDENIKGEAQKDLQAIELFPFMGAKGGEFIAYDFDEPMWEYENEDLLFRQDLIDGYSVLPDGSGALVRFRQNTQEFNSIDLAVYGDNLGVAERQYSSDLNYRNNANASLPMFGMVHGYNQNAFLAYADNGDRYMHIMSVPYGQNNVFYNWTYSKFYYNLLYFQVFNDRGDGNFKRLEERNHFNISMNYEFLQGDGKKDNLSADYIGIANAYKEVIKESLTDRKVESDNVPIRLDFLMSDVKPAIIGYEDVVMTTTNDVEEIFGELIELNITNINSGLYGYDNGGTTLHKLDKLKFNSAIGSKSDYKKLVNKYNELGIDISFVDDYLYINNETYNLTGKAVKHYNGQYCLYYDNLAGNENIDISNYLRSEVAVNYINKKLNKIINKIEPTSYTINGISNKVISHHRTSLDTCVDNYNNIYKNASEKIAINAERPNSYLWPYITRYLGAKAFNSQYTMETDSVPLISFILNDYMEVYAEYSNFSFYDKESILRMIDFNLLPSFMLTKESSHLLINTNSNKYFSTEYDIYKEKITDVYEGVNTVLKEVYNAEWLDRNVLATGVVINEYSNGKSVIINYTDEPYTYNGVKVNPMSSEVIE